MGLSIICDEMLWEPCTWCNGDGSNLADGFCDVCCNQREVPIDVSDLATLAHNLAIGAALCRVWSKTRNNTAQWISGHEVLWMPGCGRSAP